MVKRKASKRSAINRLKTDYRIKKNDLNDLVEFHSQDSTLQIVSELGMTDNCHWGGWISSVVIIGGHFESWSFAIVPFGVPQLLPAT